MPLQGVLGAEKSGRAWTKTRLALTPALACPRLCARAVEPRFNTKEADRGTGLDLGSGTVYGFAKQSRGAARLASSPGAGTTQTLYIFMGGAQQPATEAYADGPTLSACLRVLLVEDDAEVRCEAANFLQALGCGVNASDGASHSADQAQWLREGMAWDLTLTENCTRCRHARHRIGGAFAVAVSRHGRALDVGLLFRIFVRGS